MVSCLGIGPGTGFTIRSDAQHVRRNLHDDFGVIALVMGLTQAAAEEQLRLGCLNGTAIVPASIRMRIVCMSLLLLEDRACFREPVAMVKALATRRPKMPVSLPSPDRNLPRMFQNRKLRPRTGPWSVVSHLNRLAPLPLV